MQHFFQIELTQEQLEKAGRKLCRLRKQDPDERIVTKDFGTLLAYQIAAREVKASIEVRNALAQVEAEIVDEMKSATSRGAGGSADDGSIPGPGSVGAGGGYGAPIGPATGGNGK